MTGHPSIHPSIHVTHIVSGDSTVVSDKYVAYVIQMYPFTSLAPGLSGNQGLLWLGGPARLGVHDKCLCDANSQLYTRCILLSGKGGTDPGAPLRVSSLT